MIKAQFSTNQKAKNAVRQHLWPTAQFSLSCRDPPTWCTHLCHCIWKVSWFMDFFTLLLYRVRENATSLEHGIWGDWNLGFWAMMMHIWLQNKPCLLSLFFPQQLFSLLVAGWVSLHCTQKALLEHAVVCFSFFLLKELSHYSLYGYTNLHPHQQREFLNLYTLPSIYYFGGIWAPILTWVRWNLNSDQHLSSHIAFFFLWHLFFEVSINFLNYGQNL